MALIQINADLSRASKALERIAKVLERVFPDPNENIIEPSTEKDLHQFYYEIKPPREDDMWMDYGPRRNY